MTGRWVYPRLSDDEAELRRQALIDGNSEELEEPNAAPFEAGAVASPEKIDEVREAVLEAAKPWGNGEVKRSEVAEWDAAVGQALYESMDIVPADAAHRGVWAYLTLVLLPDVATRRFPDQHSQRMLGGYRNVFYRTWWRHHVLKDVEVPEGVQRLGEDELVGIFERGRVGRNTDLAAALASTVLAFRGANRSQFARDLYREVRARTGAIVLDVLTPEELHDLIQEVIQEDLDTTT